MGKWFLSALVLGFEVSLRTLPDCHQPGVSLQSPPPVSLSAISLPPPLPGRFLTSFNFTSRSKSFPTASNPCILILALFNSIPVRFFHYFYGTADLHLERPLSSAINCPLFSLWGVRSLCAFPSGSVLSLSRRLAGRRCNIPAPSFSFCKKPFVITTYADTRRRLPHLECLPHW